MAKKVLKFGGTSVGTIERILHVAEIIKKEFVAGNEIIAIVSAMAGKTNALINQSKEISNNFNKQEYTYFFNSCFNNLNTDKNVFKIIKNNIELKCEYKGLDTLSIFFVNDDIFSINGILKRE